MHLYKLIPLLLNISLPTELSEWSNGPEYIFNFNVVTAIRYAFNDSFTAYEAQNTLKCYPSPYTLLCILEDFKSTTDAHIDMFYDTYDDRSQRFFEIYFSDDSIKKLIVSPYLKRNRVMIRAIAGHFSVGFDLYRKNHRAFKCTEMTYFGDCESAVSVYTRQYKNEQQSNERFMIKPLQKIFVDMIFDKDKQLVIEKIRNLDRCTHIGRYTLLTNENEAEHTLLLSSYNIITITPNRFDSFTENIVRKKVDREYQIFYENIGLSFVSVQPAKENVQRPDNVNVVISPYASSKILTGQNKKNNE